MEPHDVLLVEVEVEGALRWAGVVLEGETVSFGRGALNDVVLPSPRVSRVHCVVRRVGHEVRLVDSGSSGGTWTGRQRMLAGGALVPEGRLRVDIPGPFWLERCAMPVAVSRVFGAPALSPLRLLSRLCDGLEHELVDQLYARACALEPGRLDVLAHGVRFEYAEVLRRHLAERAGVVPTLAANALDGTPAGVDRLHRWVEAWRELCRPEVSLDALRADEDCVTVALLVKGHEPAPFAARLDAVLARR
jgi:hypothetical protein